MTPAAAGRLPFVTDIRNVRAGLTKAQVTGKR
jgi:hypothetical protein